jgi:hypothetical protein
MDMERFVRIARTASATVDRRGLARIAGAALGGALVTIGILGRSTKDVRASRGEGPAGPGDSAFQIGVTGLGGSNSSRETGRHGDAGDATRGRSGRDGADGGVVIVRGIGNASETSTGWTSGWPWTE